ncbi:bifunctional proline dehydrogenase/L-glutamate gamma-semialdehyde dehydrogenase [Nocardioides panacihumi]|uniref:L-glutamate gamma-semialdehyde dehydrogenase n=1 Tax=Nocardioides panacihumi TaxID=400774 RepID=A0ABN2REP0_9ACTN
MPTPTYDDPAAVHELTDLLPAVEETVRRWLDTSAQIKPDKAASRLADVLDDPAGLPFTVGFIDGVIRPEDKRVAARNLAMLARDVPGFLPLHLRLAVRAGGALGTVAPGVVIPAARAALRRMVGHLLIDAEPRRLGRAVERLRADKNRLNLNLLGEAVLGREEATRRLKGTLALLQRPDVDYVSIKVSATVAPHSPWAFDAAVQVIVDSLRPLYERAAESGTFINLDMEEYRDLDLTVAVFTRLLDEQEFLGLEAGLVLQAYLPDALASMMQLQDWAADRRRRGGAPIKVRLVKGANLPMERVEASLRDWPLATWHTKQDSDTHYKRVLDYALHPDRVRNIRIGVAGHNLFDIAFAWLLAGERDVRDSIDFEMLLGMAQSQAEAVKRDVGEILLYTPVVRATEFDVAIAYLIRRLEEGASRDNFMSAVFHLYDDKALFERERARFEASLRALDRSVPAPHRTQDRTAPVDATPATVFHNVPDTDPAVAANLAWGAQILARVPSSTLGVDRVERGRVTTADGLEALVDTTTGAGAAWAALGGKGRAEVLRRAAVSLESRRAELIEVMASECGKTLDQADPEVSEAIDFANYYAHLAEQLDDVDGAVAEPVGLTVVTPPWNFPVAIPAGSTLAALAAGSPVVLKPAPQAERCGAVLAEALWEAGVPGDVLAFATIDEGDLGRSLLADPRVGRVILTGAFETAELFRSFRQDLPLLAETSGKNAIVVTPSADLDLAARDVAQSAFGHAGQKCSAASLVILVGSVATSTRFRHQLLDAVRSLHVGWPEDPSAQVGPLIEPAAGKLLDALTRLDAGERWLIEPRKLGGSGRLWSPGVKEGVRPGSRSHLTEFFGPVLSVMTAETLEEAVALQNEVSFGLTAGLHSLDPAEVRQWLDTVEAGNAYINRGITGAIVRRQPFGGWKRSAVGTGTKAGGPSYLLGLTDWSSTFATSTATPRPTSQHLLDEARRAGLEGCDRLERAFRSDAAAWEHEYADTRDVSGVEAERNALRYLPVPVTVRHESGLVTDLLRVVGAGHTARSRVSVSTAAPLDRAIASALATAGISVAVEDAAAWRTRLATMHDARVRLVGADAATAYAATGGRPDVAIHAHPVTESGRLEMLPFLREQAISITAHRFGNPTTLPDEVLPLSV